MICFHAGIAIALERTCAEFEQFEPTSSNGLMPRRSRIPPGEARLDWDRSHPIGWRFQPYADGVRNAAACGLQGTRSIHVSRRGRRSGAVLYAGVLMAKSTATRLGIRSSECEYLTASASSRQLQSTNTKVNVIS